MEDIKTVIVSRAGGTAYVTEEILPGTNKDQLVDLVWAKLGFSGPGNYEIINSSGTQLSGDVYKQVQDGENLILAQETSGGVSANGGTSWRA